MVICQFAEFLIHKNLALKVYIYSHGLKVTFDPADLNNDLRSGIFEKLMGPSPLRDQVVYLQYKEKKGDNLIRQKYSNLLHKYKSRLCRNTILGHISRQVGKSSS